MTDKAPEPFVAGLRQFFYEVVKWEFRYITTDEPDGSEESVARYVRADLATAVKQLEWEPWYFGDHFARTPFGVFNVKGNMWRKPKKRTKWEGPCADPYAAAQADFERRVKECLV